jgi:hypothetical protein
VLFGHLLRHSVILCLPVPERLFQRGPDMRTLSEDDAIMSPLPRTEQDCVAARFRLAGRIAKKQRKKS